MSERTPSRRQRIGQNLQRRADEREARIRELEGEVVRLREFVREFYGDAAVELIDAEREIARLSRGSDNRTNGKDQ
jgi:uncharacterized protein YPO0396